MNRQHYSIFMRRIVNSIPAGEYSVTLVQLHTIALPWRSFIAIEVNSTSLKWE